MTNTNILPTNEIEATTKNQKHLTHSSTDMRTAEH
jgi:hypothetical protein